MDDQSVDHAGRVAAEPTCFIGSFPDDDGPGQGVIVLRGDIDTAALSRLRVHIDGLLATATRFLEIEATGVDRYEEGLLDLLGHTQHRLTDRRGMLQVRGLHPSRLADPVPAGPDPVEFAPAPDPTALIGAAATTSRGGNIVTRSDRDTSSDPIDATSPGKPGAHHWDTAPA